MFSYASVPPVVPGIIIVGTGRKLVNTMEEHDYYYSRQRDTSIEKRESTGTEAVRVFREDWPSSRKLDENVMNERERERGLCYFKREEIEPRFFVRATESWKGHNRWNRKIRVTFCTGIESFP